MKSLNTYIDTTKTKIKCVPLGRPTEKSLIRQKLSNERKATALPHKLILAVEGVELPEMPIGAIIARVFERQIRRLEGCRKAAIEKERKFWDEPGHFKLPLKKKSRVKR